MTSSSPNTLKYTLATRRSDEVSTSMMEIIGVDRASSLTSRVRRSAISWRRRWLMRSMRREGIEAPGGLDTFAGEHLHGVAFDDVVPAFEGDAALEAFAHFVDVILEAA